MKRKRTAAMMALLLVASAPMAADVPAVDAQRINLSDALKIVLARDQDVLQAQNTVEQRAVSVKESRMQFLPDLRLDATGANTDGPIFSTAEGRIVNESTQSLDAGISSGVTLFNGFRDLASLRRARFDKSASEHELDRARESAVFDVVTQFLALMQQREQENVQLANLDSELTLERQVQQFVTAGALPNSELYQQQTIVASAQLTVVDAKRTVQLAEIDLLQTLVLDPAGTYDFEVPDPKAFGEQDAIPDLNELLVRTTRQRTDVLAERSNVDAAQQDIRIARSSYWPTLSLRAGYFSGYTDASTVPFREQLDQRGSSSIGLLLSIPIYDRSNARSESQRAALRSQSARLSLGDRQQEAAWQVRRAYVDVQSSREQLRIAEEQQRMAERAMSASLRRFQAGATTLVELTQARARYVGAQSALVNARTNVLFRRSLLDYYTGDLLYSPIVTGS